MPKSLPILPNEVRKAGWIEFQPIPVNQYSRTLKDELWLPWLVVTVTPLVMSFWIRPWAALAHWLGIAYEPALLFVLGILLCFALILYLTVVVSSLMRQNLRLAQDIALLRHRLEMLAAAPSQSSRA